MELKPAEKQPVNTTESNPGVPASPRPRVPFPWERRIERAQQLAAQVPHARQILDFYVEILKWQHGLFSRLSAAHQEHPLTGAFESDHGMLLENFGSLLNLIRQKGSEALSAQADELGRTEEGWEEKL